MIINRKPIYAHVLTIPENKINDYEIKHNVVPAGEKLLMNSFRTAFIGGQNGPKFVCYDAPTTWHTLSYENGVWMTDLPIEQRQHDQQLKSIKSGTVLIGGLGLGYAATILATRPGIKRIVIVEIAREVIDLVWPYTLTNCPEREKVEVVHADLFEYLRTTKEKFTSAYYDIWQSDSEGTFFDLVLPLIRASKHIVKKRPINWNECVMRGQLWQSLAQRVMILKQPFSPKFKAPSLEEMARPKDDKWWDWSVPFFEWILEAKPKGEQLDTMVKWYADHYGELDFKEAFTAAKYVVKDL